MSSFNHLASSQACAPWGNACVVAGTHYIPIALPSILGTVFLLAPLVAIFLKLQAAETRVRTLEEELAKVAANVDGNKKLL